MLLLPYCVFLPGSVEVPETGINGTSVRQLRSGDLTATCSDLQPSVVAGDRLQRAALDFHDVVHAIFTHKSVIPFRFPTWLSEVELRAHLEEKSEQYQNFLYEHADKVQMEVRLWPFEGTQVHASSGTEYMQRLTFRFTQLHGDALGVQHRVGNSVPVREWRVNRSRDMVRLFALVGRADVTQFREAVTAAIRPGNTRLRVSGPWPATEFLTPDEDSRGHSVVDISRRGTL
jgi:hypothetical protein